jgi:hypothetical protein
MRFGQKGGGASARPDGSPVQGEAIAADAELFVRGTYLASTDGGRRALSHAMQVHVQSCVMTARVESDAAPGP